MAFLAPLFFGSAAAAGTAGSAAASLAAATGVGGAAGTAALAGTAATSGLFGAGGALTAGGLAKGAMLAGSGLSTFSNLQQGQAAGAAAQYNARLAEIQGQVAENQLRRDARRTTGAIRARVAKTGARMEGTPLMVLAESEADAELDLLDQRWSTAQTARTYRQQGRQAVRESRVRAGTSLLTAAGNMF